MTVDGLHPVMTSLGDAWQRSFRVSGEAHRTYAASKLASTIWHERMLGVG